MTFKQTAFRASCVLSVLHLHAYSLSGPNGPVTTAIYSAIAITWTIAALHGLAYNEFGNNEHRAIKKNLFTSNSNF